MTDEKQTLELSDDVKESLNFLQELKKEKEAKRKVDTIKKEYLADEQKKMLWEAGLGEKLENNFLKVDDKDWLEGQLELAVERVKMKAQLEMQRAEAEKQENEDRGPAQPGSAPVEGNGEQPTDFNKASMDVFTNEEFRKKLTKEQQIFLNVNKPSKNPAWY